jgi:CspA family cold shock protein
MGRDGEGPKLCNRQIASTVDVLLHLAATLRVVYPPFRPTVRLQSGSGREYRGHSMTTGTVKKVVAERGFGFISAEDGKEYFFHRGGLLAPLDFDRLVGGERVSFEIETSPKGPRAIQVSAA